MKRIANSIVSARGSLALGNFMPALAGVVLCGLVGIGGPALAQGGAAPQAMEQVMITSPLVIKRDAVNAARAQGLRNPELVSISRPVSYSDLDMSKPADVAQLQTRARNTVRDVCQELGQLYPRTGGQFIYTNTDCVKKATDEAMDTIKQIADAASK
jgi:UrcA family protein